MSRRLLGLAGTLLVLAVACSCGYCGEPYCLVAEVSGSSDFDVWKQETLKFYRDSLGLGRPDLPLLLESDLIVDESETVWLSADLVRFKIRYPTWDGRLIPAFLFLPRSKKPVPAVLVYHGHGAGKIESAEGDGTTENAIARDLADQLGYAVLAPDTRSFGEFTIDGLEHGNGLSGWVYEMEMNGTIITSLIVKDGLADLAALVAMHQHELPLLDGLAEVDPDRIAIAGISNGCWRALNVAAHSQKAAAVVASGLFIRFDYLFHTGVHCACQHAIPLEREMEMSHLGGLILPGALMIQWGLEDRFYQQGAEELIDCMKEAYFQYGQPELLEVDLNAGLGHQFNNDSVARWLLQILGEGAWHYRGPN
jgi:dienelactone hydrolase